MKTKTKIILSYILLQLIFISQSYSAVFHPNTAGFESNSFNNGSPVDTGPNARVQVIPESTFSGSIKVSDSSFNIAGFESTSFNNGLPVDTGPKAKVVVDKTLNLAEGQDLRSLGSFNIAAFNSNSFNNGIPVDTGPKARVIVNRVLGQTNSGSYTYGDTYSNIAAFNSNSFNNGIPVDTGPTADVLVALVTWENGELNVQTNANYNSAGFESNSFNNGLPVSVGPTAKVEFIQEELFFEDEYITGYEDPIDGITYTDIQNNQIIGGSINIYTNSKHFIYQGMYRNNQNINLQDISSNFYNKRGPGGTIVMGDMGLIQQLITHTPDNKKLSYNDNNNFVISDGEIYASDTAVLQVNLKNDLVTPPVLTYPYPEIVGTGSTSKQKYKLRTNYPTIKGMAYPGSIMNVTIGSETYYVKVDNNGLFEFTPSKKIPNEKIDISFQYTMLEGPDGLSIDTNKKLSNNKVYNIEIVGNEDYTQPYITSIYNDDYIYTDVFHMAGFANPGIPLNYNLKKINGDTVTQGETIVNQETKQFSFILGDKGVDLTPGKDYIIEVWQGNYTDGGVERKAFRLMGSKKQSIGILNIKDHHILPTLKPTFIGYSRENIINNDTIRIFACDISGDDGGIKPCLEENREFLGTTNAGKNGLFEFTPLQSLKNDKYYEFEFINTRDMSKYKKVLIKTDILTESNIINSQVTSIYSGLNINSKKLNISGFTLPKATVEIGTDNTIADDDGRFNIIVDFVENFEIKFKKLTSNYILDYSIIESDRNINNMDGNYFQYFNSPGFDILELKR